MEIKILNLKTQAQQLEKLNNELTKVIEKQLNANNITIKDIKNFIELINDTDRLKNALIFL